MPDADQPLLSGQDGSVNKMLVQRWGACVRVVDKRWGYPQGDLSPVLRPGCQQRGTYVVHRAPLPLDPSGLQPDQRPLQGVGIRLRSGLTRSHPPHVRVDKWGPKG